MDAELRNRNDFRKMVEEGWFAPENREKILAGLAKMKLTPFEQDLKDRYRDEFPHLTVEQIVALLDQFL